MELHVLTVVVYIAIITLENQQDPVKINIYGSYDITIPFLGIPPHRNINVCSTKDVYENVHSNILQSNSKMEISQLSKRVMLGNKLWNIHAMECCNNNTNFL